MLGVILGLLDAFLPSSPYLFSSGSGSFSSVVSIIYSAVAGAMLGAIIESTLAWSYTRLPSNHSALKATIVTIAIWLILQGLGLYLGAVQYSEANLPYQIVKFVPYWVLGLVISHFYPRLRDRNGIENSDKERITISRNERLATGMVGGISSETGPHKRRGNTKLQLAVATALTASGGLYFTYLSYLYVATNYYLVALGLITAGVIFYLYILARYVQRFESIGESLDENSTK